MPRRLDVVRSDPRFRASEVRARMASDRISKPAWVKFNASIEAEEARHRAAVKSLEDKRDATLARAREATRAIEHQEFSRALERWRKAHPDERLEEDEP